MKPSKRQRGVGMRAPGRQALDYCGFRTGLRPVPLNETDARSLGVIWTCPVIASKAMQSRGRCAAPAGFGGGVTQPLDCFVARAPRNDGERLFLVRYR